VIKMAETNVTIHDVAKLIVLADTNCTIGSRSYSMNLERIQCELEATFVDGKITLSVADKPSLI
jgi:hypothetical protein